MSMRALALGTRDYLRSVLSLDSTNSEVCIDGQPPAFAGEWFYAVHPGGWRHQSSGDDHPDEVYSLSVTLTTRGGRAPFDRWWTEILALADTGLLARAEAVRAKLHLNYSAMAEWNTNIAGEGVTVAGFVEPLRFESCTAPQRRGPSWFHGKGARDSGFSLTLSFGGARRIQDVVGMT